MPARLQSIVVDRRRQDLPRNTQSNGHKINNTSTPAGGNNSWKNECRACGFSHHLADCRNVTPAKRQFRLERSERPSRFGNRNRPPTFNNGGEAFEVEAVGVPKAMEAAVPFPALAMFASNRATLRSFSPALALKFIKLMWPSGALIMVGSTRWTFIFRMWLHFKAANLMRLMPPLTVISYHRPTPLSPGLLLYSRTESILVFG